MYLIIREYVGRKHQILRTDKLTLMEMPDTMNDPVHGVRHFAESHNCTCDSRSGRSPPFLEEQYAFLEAGVSIRSQRYPYIKI